jgi:xanthine dehydrogenase accessory factor
LRSQAQALAGLRRPFDNGRVQVLLEEILRRCRDAGERVALCVVVGTRGSTPQERGAKMLVTADGRTVGTLGGGCVEAEVRKRALEMLQNNESRLMEFALDHDYGWDDGLICGGVMDIHIQTISPGTTQPFEALLERLRAQDRCELRFVYEQTGEQREYVEELSPGPMLVIAGAGHVGQALGELATKLEFRLTVIDDRADFASHARFPGAQTRIVGDIESELRRFPIDPATYIVIVTRGHQHDGRALAAVIDSPARYIGLIGSKRKIKTIFDDLAQTGVSLEKLKRVHAPIGYRIGAVTVSEIALSIAAELIAVRRGMENQPALPMKIDSQQLEQWIARPSRAGSSGTQPLQKK